MTREAAAARVLLALSGLCAGVFGCAPPSNARPPDASEPAPGVSDLSSGAWGEFRSKRFGMRLPLPEGRDWQIRDRDSAWLVAVHPASSSQLLVRLWREDDLMNRVRCEERARALRELPVSTGADVLEERVLPLPAGFDTRIVTGVHAGKPGEPIEGFVTAFGGWAHRCFAYVFTTRADGKRAPVIVANRLAAMVEGSFAKLSFENELEPVIPRTVDTEGAESLQR